MPDMERHGSVGLGLVEAIITVAKLQYGGMQTTYVYDTRGACPLSPDSKDKITNRISTLPGYPKFKRHKPLSQDFVEP